MAIRLSPTQLRALRKLARLPVYYVADYHGAELTDAVKGAKSATYDALCRVGLASCRTKSYRESVPAGPFGRTAHYGYKSKHYVEAEYTITEDGLRFLEALKRS